MYESKELLLAVILSVVFGGLFAGGFYMKEKFMDWLEKDDGKEEKKKIQWRIKRRLYLEKIKMICANK